ncbi:hypothetical protein SAMN02949497_4651 [Methylomagnum ishizawai]|uniref:Uncharacterized protein n=1 Tax=Methylomagnum ishizawai TaxID=1760988 RepID=A0A1Y6D3Q0_9GAMM|nr:hypothetical protein [Methylomagnum ishizawai]SMF97231.1 hypothetical protein SAMN02949497_4651 [Methylomagnum ishizawai]
MLERKHRVRQVVAVKTRGQITAMVYEAEPPVLAKAGVKPPMADKKAHNGYMLKLYLDRGPGQRIEFSHLISPRQQLLTGSDLVEVRKSMFLNLEFDFKRRPVNPRMVAVDGVQHLACDTVPWPTALEGEEARAIFDGWRRAGHCLKTLEDFVAWEEYYAARVMTRNRSINVTQEGAVGLLRRSFLAAYAQGAWGTSRTMNYREVAAWLTAKGYPTTESGAKNGKRAKLVEGVVPATPAALALMAILLEAQPSLEVDRFFGKGTNDAAG